MFSKIIFVLATVCVINAAVITGSDNDAVHVLRRCRTFTSEQKLLKWQYNPETEVAANPKSCNYQACHQLCRRLKFPGGTCVNGRCKCDNFLNAEDGVAENPLTDLEDLISLKDDPETEFAKKPSKCYLKLCNLLCRKLNNTSGACVDGRCKCDEANKPEVFEALLSNPEDSVSSRACNNQKCNQLCRKKKFRGGACIGPNCYCNKFLSLQDDAVSVTLSNEEDSVTPKRCTEEACNVLCRKLKFQEGFCIASRCRCKNYIPLQKDNMMDLEESLSLQDNFLSDDTEDEVLENPLSVSELSEDQTERSCNLRACEQLCRRLKFPGGTCVNGRCKCDNFFRTEDADAVDEYSASTPRRVCKIKRCNRTCTRRGYEGARCVNGACECFNKKQTDPSFLNEETIDEQEDANLIVRTIEDVDAVDEYSELAPRRVCKIRECNRTCTRRGYEKARCVNGICKCFNKIQKDPAFLNEVTIDEEEDSNLVERTNEEELDVPSARRRPCNPETCKKKCRFVNLLGGWCFFGTCTCL